MKTYLKYILPIALLASCKEEEQIVPPENPDAVEMKGVVAEIAGNTATRAAALDAYNYVGRSAFVNNDVMVLTTIRRTVSPINGFTYSGIEYKQEIETGQTSGGWNRDMEKGHSLNEDGSQNPNHPERIYWSDSHNAHTYIGYSLPQRPSGMRQFDWVCKSATYGGAGTEGIDVYYGCLGNPYELTDPNNSDNRAFIDYTNDAGDEGVKDDPSKESSAISKKSGNDKIMRDDLLLTYDDKKVAEIGGSVAKLYYHHALAMVRVVVNIQGFSASSEAADSKSVVSDMVLKDMLTLYKWRQQSYGAEALDAAYDTNNINDIYNDGGKDIIVQVNQTKDVHLWIPRPNGTGTGVGKQFTFYGLAVPTKMGVDNASTEEDKAKNLHFEFSVEYPDPMNPDTMVKKSYKAMMPNSVEFRAGHCTTINISLNHSNEQMTVGAEYMDWQLVETPDQSELKKGSTFMENTLRSSVTIFGDKKATADDATWLYVDPTSRKILDVYGNDGSAAHPFKISTAEQLLSFAYEVKGTDRKAVEQVLIIAPPEEYTLIDANGAFDFTGYYVSLDADITMQKSLEGTDVIWPGIGDNTNKFNGYFNGGFRHINKLYGKAFFNTIGADGIVDHIFISDAIEISGSGSIAEKNEGIICGSHVEGDIVDNTYVDYCGSIVGVNTGVLIACSHIGSITGNANILGALLGKNDGILVTCYNVGDAKNNASGKPAYAGVGDYTTRSVAYCCYFNKDFYTAQDYSDLQSKIGHVAFPLTTAVMQSNKYVNQDAAANPEGTNTGEIMDPYVKTDMFYWHWSLNVGLTRAIAYLSKCLDAQKDKDEIEFHAPGKEDTDTGVDRVKLKKTQVQWLVNHYAGHSHQFQFIPGTYPKLQ